MYQEPVGSMCEWRRNSRLSPVKNLTGDRGMEGVEERWAQRRGKQATKPLVVVLLEKENQNT